MQIFRTLVLLALVAVLACMEADSAQAIKQKDPAVAAPHTVAATSVDNYVFGNYKGPLEGPHHADGNPRRAVIISWNDKPQRFVFWHEASYCPFLELPSGAALSYQFFEGNDGWAELFNDYGRREKNSSVRIIERGPRRVWVQWTYSGVNQEQGRSAYRAVEDFFAYPNGLIVRQQRYKSLMPGEHKGYAREPIETIAMCPVGKLWYDVLQPGTKPGQWHALAALDPFSDKRYDVCWARRPNTLWKADPERQGASWKDLDDSRGIIFAIPMRDGSPFCAFGDASGFDHTFTTIKEHSFKDTGGNNWKSLTWDHWPIGWMNSQSHELDESTLNVYPNHFSPAGMDLYKLADAKSAARTYTSLIGVVPPGKEEQLRVLVRTWLDRGARPIDASELATE